MRLVVVEVVFAEAHVVGVHIAVTDYFATVLDLAEPHVLSTDDGDFVVPLSFQLEQDDEQPFERAEFAEEPVDEQRGELERFAVRSGA